MAITIGERPRIHMVLSAKPQSPNCPRWATAIVAAAVIAVAFAVFLPTRGHDFLNWDDNVNFTDNPSFRGLGPDQFAWMFTRFHNGHYQPITWLTLGFDTVWGQAIFGEHPRWGRGMDPRAFHVSNAAWHAINAGLLYLVAVRLIAAGLYRDMTRRTWLTLGAAAAGALLFATHPLRVENVAWITERRDLVGAALMLCSVLAYLRSAQAGRPHAALWLILSIAVYTLSLMAKVSAVPLVAALLAIDWFPLRRLGSWTGSDRVTSFIGWTSPAARRVLLEKIPFAAIAMVFGSIASYFQSSRGWMFSYELHPLSDRIAQSFYGLAFYLWKTIAPWGLLPLYELRFPMNASESRFAISFLVIGVLFVAVFLARRRVPGLWVALVAYAAFLSPVLGLFQNGPQIVADRYAYLPSMGLCLAIGGGAAWLIETAANRRLTAILASIAAAACIIGISVLTVRQSEIWRDSQTLWTFMVRADPRSSIAHNSLGAVHLAQSRPQEAAEHFQRAVELDPLSKGYRQNLRQALRDSGRFNELVAAWVDEAKFGSLDFVHHYNAGTSAMNRGDYGLALEHLSVSVALRPTEAAAHHNLAATLEMLARLEEAARHYRRAVELAPNAVVSRVQFAEVLRKLNRPADAVVELREALAIEPHHTRAQQMLRELQQP